MIISASRRTDIPAFYSKWFMGRIREGFCEVANPFSPSQVSRVSLRPDDVDVVVFWTRNAAPLLPHLRELDKRGYRYYFLYTVLDYPELLEPHTPAFETRVETFRRLADTIGAERVIWRYDPIVLSTITPVEFHKETFARIAADLHKSTDRCVISFVDIYRKLTRRLRWLEQHGCTIREPNPDETAELAYFISSCAQNHGMLVQSCAETIDLTPWNIPPGQCIDDAYIGAIFGLAVDSMKDPSQRPACGCVVSKDIGSYDTCLHGCRYCYATSSEEKAQERFALHDPKAPSLLSAP
ncbi:MAG: DUF1848 domain-containing protein [Candidatus Hydrogenedentota bacterium]